MSTLRLFLLLILLPLAAGCELLGSSDDETPAATGVLVANQGNFTDANGSVTAYDPATGQATPNVVGSLGALLQSLHLSGGRLYVVANTGDRIDVFDAGTYARLGQIDSLLSPRYLLEGPDGHAYVTSLYGAPGSFTGGKVTVVDLATGHLRRSVAVGDNPEGMALVGSRLYVANNGFGAGRTVSVVDTGTGAVAATIDVGCDGPRFVLADDDDDVFVLCTGQTLYDTDFNVVGETMGAVRVLDGATGAVVARIDLETRLGTPGPGQDAFYAPETDELYVAAGGDTVLRFDTRANALSARLGPFAGAPIGAVAYDAAAERLYVAHVPGFTQRGTVTVHDRNGSLLTQFEAGVAPAYIAFRREDD